MILADIREKTSESHRQLEQSNLLSLLTHPTLTLEHYVSILDVFYGYFYPLEKEIDAFGLLRKYLPDYDTRRKAALLREDLQYLKGTYLEATQEVCPDLPEVKTAAQALGCLYVLEGSTLGGRVIARNLEKTLGLYGSNGASFFNGYGQDTGKKWKMFQQAMAQFSMHTDQDYEMIEAANATFNAFKNWIKSNDTCQ